MFWSLIGRDNNCSIIGLPPDDQLSQKAMQLENINPPNVMKIHD